jgi:hypothetical protein
MKLEFTRRFPAGLKNLSLKPTYFIDKISRCLVVTNQLKAIDFCGFYDSYKYKFDKSYDLDETETPKLHTIRRNLFNKWQETSEIEFCINRNSEDEFQFAPTTSIIALQFIRISYNEADCEKACSEPAIYIDEKPIDLKTLSALAVNDGFENVVDFLTYFNTNFTGIIIHWTNLKY